MPLAQPYARPNMAGASDEHGAVAAFMFKDGSVTFWKCAPSSLERFENRKHLHRLFDRARAKLRARRKES